MSLTSAIAIVEAELDRVLDDLRGLDRGGPAASSMPPATASPARPPVDSAPAAGPARQEVEPDPQPAPPPPRNILDGDPFECVHCGQPFKTKQGRSLHVTRSHPIGSTPRGRELQAATA